MKKFIKNPVFIISVILVILSGFIYLRHPKTPAYDFVIAKKADLFQKVSVTGRVEPAEDVSLAFEKSGKVSNIYIEVGDKIKTGQILARLDNAELYTQLSQAQADLNTQKAKLEELKRGTREEEIKVKEAELKKAQQDLVNDYDDVLEILNDAYNKADDAVRKQVDELFSSDEESNPQLTFSISDFQVKIDAEFQRASLTPELKKWSSELNVLNTTSTPSTLDEGLKNAKSHLTIIRNFLNKIMDAVVNAVAISQTTINTYKTNINTARTNINTVLTDISDQQQTISSQKITVEKIQNELNLELAGALPEQIQAQEAQVEKAQANVLNYEVQIAKTVIRSPIAGTITKQDAKVGEIIPANTPVISVISSAKLEIEADIYEEDIVKIKVGDPVDIKIVAFPQKTFKGKVISINPAEKIIQEVVYYEVTADFEEIPEGIKPGMTADMIIRTASKENILIVPREAVKEMDNKTIIDVFKNGEIEEREIIVGLKGNDFFEVISGLEEGEQIVIGKK